MKLSATASKTMTIPLGAPLPVAAVALSTCGILVSVTAAVWLAVRSNRFAVRVALPGVTATGFAALAAINAGVLFTVSRPVTTEWCVARIWVVRLGVATVLACWGLKAGRLRRIDAAWDAAVAEDLSEPRVVMGVVCVLALQCGALAYWTAAEFPHANETGSACVSSMWAGQVVTLAMEAVMWLAWMYWAVATHHLGTRLTETSWMSALVVAVSGAAALLAGYLGPGSILPPAASTSPTQDQTTAPATLFMLFDAQTQLVVESGAGFFATCVLTVLVLWPKVRAPTILRTSSSAAAAAAAAPSTVKKPDLLPPLPDTNGAARRRERRRPSATPSTRSSVTALSSKPSAASLTTLTVASSSPRSANNDVAPAPPPPPYFARGSLPDMDAAFVWDGDDALDDDSDNGDVEEARRGSGSANALRRASSIMVPPPPPDGPPRRMSPRAERAFVRDRERGRNVAWEADV